MYATLNDSRGWPRAGLTFVESGSSKCDMTYILAAAEYMKSFSSLCSSQYSCRVGNQVIINYDRWREPTDSWLKGGGNLAIIARWSSTMRPVTGSTIATMRPYASRQASRRR